MLVESHIQAPVRQTGIRRSRRVFNLICAVIICGLAMALTAQKADAGVTLKDGTYVTVDVACNLFPWGSDMKYNTYSSSSTAWFQPYLEYFDSQGRRVGTGQYGDWVQMPYGNRIATHQVFFGRLFNYFVKIQVRFFSNGVYSPWYGAGVRTNESLGGNSTTRTLNNVCLI